jgi:hypothetical protein
MDYKYILPNKIGFIDFIQNEYHPDKIDKYTEEYNKKYKQQIYMHQMLINKYMNINTPYRGLLLYHELGTGKTMTSIGILNQYLLNNKKIFVLLPASLRNNFIKELFVRSYFKKYSNNNTLWTKIEYNNNLNEIKTFFNEYTIKLKKNNYCWIANFNNKDKFNKTKLINIKYKDLSENDKEDVNLTINSIILNKINFIHYNGLTDKNIIKFKGNINIKELKNWLFEQTWYKIDIDNKKFIKEKYGINLNYFKNKYTWVPFYNYNKNYIEKVNYSDISNEINKKEINNIIDNILNKDNVMLFVDTFKPPNINIYKNYFDNSLIIIDEAHKFIRTISNESQISITLYNYLLNSNNSKFLLLSGTPIVNKVDEIIYLLNLLRGPIITYNINKKLTNIDNAYLKYIDFFDSNNKSSSITLLPYGYIRDPTNNNFIIKQKWINNNTDILNNIFKNENYKIKTYYTFPTNKKDIDNLLLYNNESFDNEDLIKRRIMGLISFVDYDKNKSNFPTQYPMKKIYIDMSDLQFNRFMKMREDEDKIEEVMKKKNKNNINIENQGVFKAFSRLTCNLAFPENIDRQFPKDLRLIKKLNGEDINNNKDYIKHISDIKTQFKSTNFTEEELNQISPKFIKIIKDINNLPGKILVYTQFRELEGVGLFTDFLNKYGYSEALLNKNNKLIDDNITTYKRYCVFDLDKEKANQQIKYFNNIKNNLNGENIKILIITESGSEGISLKAVRNVLIIEPHWNTSIIKQVIGRAVRNNSHIDLPPDERTVNSYMYLMQATPLQIKKNKTFQYKYKLMTTDQEILHKAEEKQKKIDKLLYIMKQSAFDCNILSKNNNFSDCYKWPFNIDKKLFAYTPNFYDENFNTIFNNNTVNKKIKPIVVIRKKDNYKFIKYKNKYYDYFAYINSNQLIPINFNLFDKNKLLNYKNTSNQSTQSTQSTQSSNDSSNDSSSDSSNDSSSDSSNNSSSDSSTDLSSDSINKSNDSSSELSNNSSDKIIDSNKIKITDPIITKEQLKQNKLLLNSKYNNKYIVEDVGSDGNCFYRAIYKVLNHTKNIFNFIDCFNKRSGWRTKKKITEDEFVFWIRKDFLAKKTLLGQDNGISLATFNFLSELDENLYKLYISENWFDYKNLKNNKPSNIKKFREIIAEYIGKVEDNATYACQYDIDLLTSYLNNCNIKFKISPETIFDGQLPPIDYNFKENYIYLYRINKNHYQAILLL